MTIGPTVGDPAPGFTLPDTAGNPVSLDAVGAPATVVVFTCNHCPYALAWHHRINDLARDYAPRGVRLLQINSNDSVKYPADSLAAMQVRVAGGELAGPYLHDETQAVARAYGAKTTPDVFVIAADGRIAYRGAPDADYSDESQNARWLREALDQTLAGEPVARPATEPMGCSIKWRD